MNDFLLGSKRIHTVVLVVILILAAFLRWYRLDNCVMCSQDEWMSLTATFYFLQKVANHGIFSATAFEFSAGFPLADVGRLGPPFDYTRSLMLVWTMPYYAVVALFDFPVSEGWYRFRGHCGRFLRWWQPTFSYTNSPGGTSQRWRQWRCRLPCWAISC